MKKRLLSFISFIALVTTLVACGGKSSTSGSSISDSSNSGTSSFHDYTKDGSVQLKLDYEGKDFYVDGIGQVNLFTPIDGDTAHFTPLVDSLKKGTIKSRFYGIDTPESTGKVEPWGHAASEFTKSKLKEADKNGTIVVSSPADSYQAPSPDSTGSRYVSLIWINLKKKNAPISELVLLNLWIVQEGLSYVRNITDIPEYETSFDKAAAQAEAMGLYLWSNEDDPDFNYGGYSDVSLLDVKREIEKSIADKSYVNKYNNQKIRFTGTVAGFANNTLYVQDYYPNDEDDPSKGGEYAGINIFTGMSPIPTQFRTRGAYIRVVGLAQDSETFGFQVTDTQGHWVTYKPTLNDCEVLIKASDNTGENALYTFQYTAEELSNVVETNNYESLYCSVEVTTNVTVSNAYKSDSNAFTLHFKDMKFDAYFAFAYFGDPDNPAQTWVDVEDFVGKTFSIKGVYSWRRTSSGNNRYQVNPTTSTDLVWIKDSK